jgi:uncharacterized protein (TIGR02145 family)
MAENLNYAAEGSKCYDDDPANCEKYGRLYNWSTALALPSVCNGRANSGDCLITKMADGGHQGICPEGWRIANNTDWTNLFPYVDEVTGGKGTSTGVTYQSTTASKHLVALDNSWNGFTEESKDPFGFSDLPSGAYLYVSGYSDLYSMSYHWSGSAYTNTAGNHVSLYLYGTATAKLSSSSSFLKSENFLSVRCIKKD